MVEVSFIGIEKVKIFFQILWIYCKSNQVKLIDIFLKSSLWFLQITSFQPCPVSSLKTLCEIGILRSEEQTTVFHGTMATIARKNRPGSIYHQYIIRIYIINISHNCWSIVYLMRSIYWWWSKSFIEIFSDGDDHSLIYSGARLR